MTVRGGVHAVPEKEAVRVGADNGTEAGIRHVAETEVTRMRDDLIQERIIFWRNDIHAQRSAQIL